MVSARCSIDIDIFPTSTTSRFFEELYIILGVIHKRRRPIFLNLWPPSLPLLAQITKGWCDEFDTNFTKQHVGCPFSYNHALFWCQWLPMDENYFLRWSLNMTRPQRICYSLRANGARNGVISIGQWGVFNQKVGVVTTITFSNHKTY